MKDSFLVKTEVFQGPLDLLLSLIEKKKLMINELSLAKITDDYLNFVDQSEQLSLQKNAHFILIAATLVLIKSKSLLPTLDLTREEEDSIQELETRLKVYQRMKETEPWIIENFGTSPKYFKQDSKIDGVIFAPPKNLNLGLIKEAALGVIKSLPKVEKIPERTVKKVISLEESIVNLSNRIRQNINMSFKEFSRFDKEERVNVVVSFLAMLELVKQGAILASQEGQYQEIDMQTREFDTPNYS
jgi:segregation and condensation protein A